MRKRYELNGKNYSVDPTSEKGKAWLKENTTAKLIGTIVPKKDQSSAKDATTEQKPTASSQEAGQPQNNTELNLEDGSSESVEASLPLLPFGSPLFAKSFGDKAMEVVGSLKNEEERQKTGTFLKRIFWDNVPEKLTSAFASYMAMAQDVNKRQFEALGLDVAAKAVEQEGIIKGSEVANKLNSGQEIETELGKLQIKDTGEGVVKGFKKGSAADVIGGMGNAIYGTAETVIPAAATGGLSLIPQMTGPMYVSYNTEKAKALYGDDPDAIKKLVENDEAEVAVPMALGAVAYGLEKVGFKGVMKHAVGKAVANKTAGSLIGTMNKEGVTELLQGGVNKFNDSIGSQVSVEEASIQAWNHMTSDEGLEEYFMGVIGGGVISSGGRAINRALRNDTESIKYVNESIDSIAELNRVKNKSKSKAFKESIQVEINQLESDLKKYVEKSRGLKNYLTEDQKSSMLDLLAQKDEINTNKDNLLRELSDGKINRKDYGYALRSLNNQDKKVSNSLSAIKQEALKAEVNRQAEQVKEQIKVTGLEGTVKQMTSEEIKSMESTDKFDSKDASQSYGFIRDFGDGSFEIVLNKDKPAVGVAAHEFLHAVLKSTLKGDVNTGKQLADALNSHVDTLEGDQSKLKDRLKSYEGDQNIGEETITLMSESILNGDLKFNESFFTKIGDVIRRFLQNTGIKEIELNTGRDVYNFIKDYNRSIKTGKLSKSLIKVAKEGAKGKLVEGVKETTEESVKASRDAKIPIDQLGKVDSDGQDMTEPGIGNFLYQAEADEVVRKIKEEGYLDNLIAAKYKVRPVPEGFVNDVLAELTPHIKAFKPESNDSLFGWIQSQIANKAGNVYNKIYKDKGPAKTVDIGATTSEGAPIVQIEADIDIEMQRIDEIGLNEEQVQERSKFRRALRLDDAMVDKVISTVRKTLGTNLPNVSTKKFKQALAKAFKTDLKKPMQDLMGKGKDYDLFLKKFMPSIYKHLPVEVLVQMERNLDPDLRIFTSSRRITKPIEVDKLIAEGKLPKDVSRTSGPLLNTKLPYPGDENILAFFRGTNSQELLGYKKGASTYGTRKDVLAERTITEVAFDAVTTVIQEQDVASKIEDLNIAGIDKVENDLAIIAKQIDRDPTIKFSKAAIGIKKENVPVFSSKFNQVLNRINSNETLPTDKKGLKKIIKDIYESDLDNSEMNAVVNKIIRYSTDFLDQKQKTKDLAYVDIKLTDYILEATEKDVVDKSIMQLLSNVLPSGYKTAASFFNDKARVNKARSAFSNFVQGLRDSGLSENEILRLLDTQYKGMYASSSKISAGQFSVEFVDGAYVVVESDGKVGTHRGQVFQNVADFYRVAGYPDYKQDLKSVNTKTFAETSKAAVADKNYEGRLKQAKEARQAVLKIMDYYFNKINKGELDYGDLLMLSKMFLSNMNSPMKRAANLAYIAEGVENINPKDMGRLTEYEHMMPTSVMVLKLFTAYVKDGKASESIFNGYEVAVIPKSMDKVLIKNGLRDFLPITYKEGDSNWKRYFNKQTLGESNLVPIVNIKTGEVIGKDFVEASSILNTTEVGQKGMQLLGSVSTKYSKAKGMSTFDFDETLIIGGKNFVVATDPKTGDTAKISSEEWPIKGPDYADAGWSFDFSDFANVRGGKEGPLLQKMKNQIKKYGNKNVFVLTARQQASAKPIKEWLKSQGIDIPLKNITGLGKSEGEAKGEWMLQKFAEGYNDMYFVDDALPNVKAVKKVLDQLDIKSKVVQAKVKFSKSASQDFNKMLERSKGVSATARISDVDAKLRGAKRDKFRLRFFVPPSAEDFKGLVYAFLGKGKQGNQDMQWFKDNLFTPFAEGTKKLNSLRQRMSEDYTALKKQFPDVVKSLNDKVANTEFTIDNAIRVYLWNMAGFETPGLSDAQKKLLIDTVAMDPKLVAFADILSNITRTEEGYVEPKDYWVTQNIGSDLHTVAETINRKRFLAEWQENADLVFSKENLNKIEAIYGSNFREALEDMLYRMKTGSNRPSGRTSVENKFLNWVNGAVSAVMFFNMRSAALQSLSMVNFINFEDNNMFAASKAFADQKQFWEDFLFLFNSDYGKQRRAGLKIDVSASELTDAFAQGKNKTEAVIKYMLEKGFIPTKMMDSFAIAMGGSTFYRNRVNKLMKEGMSQSEAENQAFLDFQEIAEETQQSSRPDLISMQQASSLGRLILAWANTPMQYTRLTKKALSDIINGRGDLKSNVSRILYYGAIQNIIFGTLQTGLAFLMFGDDEEDKDRDKKEQRVLNGMLDTLLRGVGVYGALVSTAKNTLIAAYEELGKGFGQKDYSKIMQQLVNLSPPVGSKVRKIIGAIKSYDFNKNIIDQMGHGINNPAWNIFTGVVEGATNAPLDRIRAKLVNVREAFVGDHEMWQRIALVMGWNKWDLNVEDAEIKEAREEVKEKKKQERKVKQKQSSKSKEKKKEKKVRCFFTKADGRRCKNKTTNKNKKCYAHQ